MDLKLEFSYLGTWKSEFLLDRAAFHPWKPHATSKWQAEISHNLKNFKSFYIYVVLNIADV